MNPAKRIMLFGEFAEARKWYLKHGRTREEADAMRGKLIEKALGKPKSMSAGVYWTDDEITKVKMAFKAVYDGGNFKAQMEGLENARKQARLAEAELRVLIAEIYPHQTGEDSQYKWDSTIEKMARRVCKKRLEECSAHEIKKIIGEFKQQKARNEKKAADAIAHAHAASEKFSVEDYLG
jgi:hypothetical protein